METVVPLPIPAKLDIAKQMLQAAPDRKSAKSQLQQLYGKATGNFVYLVACIDARFPKLGFLEQVKGLKSYKIVRMSILIRPLYDLNLEKKLKLQHVKDLLCVLKQS